MSALFVENVLGLASSGMQMTAAEPSELIRPTDDDYGYGPDTSWAQEIVCSYQEAQSRLRPCITWIIQTRNF